MEDNNNTTLEQTGLKRRSREQILALIKADENMYAQFLKLSKSMQEQMLEFCMGKRGLLITYDPFFKMIFNPEENPERLSVFLSALLKQKVVVKRVLPSESSRLTAEGSLLIMDILVELESGALANVEMQKIGYLFPGERGACYSSDLVLRQYARVKEERAEKFAYKDMEKVYTIVLMEKSGREFHAFPEDYYHYGKQEFDTGIELNLLQEYIYIPLDIFLDNFHENTHNEIKELDAWLCFLSSDNLEDMLRILEAYPDFIALYREIMEFQAKPEELIGMFSEALEIMDRNTTRYMIEEQAKEIEEQKKVVARQKKALTEKDIVLTEKEKALAEQKKALDKQAKENAMLKAELEKLKSTLG